MVASPADVVNEALQLIGGFDNFGPVTGSPPLFDGTPAGTAAGQLYLPTVATVGRQFGWDFSRNLAALTLTGNPPPLGYTYEYFYPTNGIQVRQLVPPAFTDPNNPIPVRWTVGNEVAASLAATGLISFATNPSNGDTLLLNGVAWTFVAGAPVGNQTQIGGTLGFTLAVLANNLNSSANASLIVAAYSQIATGVIQIVYKTLGPTGNNYTLAASAASVSGPTLTGGANTQQKTIWTNLQNAVASFSNQPSEGTWDPLFRMTVVRLLASGLALALSGKPDTAALVFEQAGGFEKAGEMRTES